MVFVIDKSNETFATRRRGTNDYRTETLAVVFGENGDFDIDTRRQSRRLIRHRRAVRFSPRHSLTNRTGSIARRIKKRKPSPDVSMSKGNPSGTRSR